MSGKAHIEKKIKDKFYGEGSGHDWWHIQRVRNLARKIALTEKADQEIVDYIALLHDVADYKLEPDPDKAYKQAQLWLQEAGCSSSQVVLVIDQIKHISFKGAGVKDDALDLAGMIVQDADRLDAIGAIGIARTFMYGGHKSRQMHNPEEVPAYHQSTQQYRQSTSTVINHFYEKLLLLKDRMHTTTAKNIAQERHQFLQHFLDRFFNEWRNES